MTDEQKKDDACETCGEYLAGWKRALADYDNLKKETAREHAVLRELATARAAEGLLRLCDQMDVAISRLPPDPGGGDPYLEGIRIFRAHCQQ